MSNVPDVTLWPSRENYARFRALCDDEVPETFDEFEIAATRQLKAMAREGIHVQRLAFDPDEVAAWCRTHYGNVNSYARMGYAAHIALARKDGGE
jgi:hypothetical protein